MKREETKPCIYTFVNRNSFHCSYIFFLQLSRANPCLPSFLPSFFSSLFDSWKRIETFGSRRSRNHQDRVLPLRTWSILAGGEGETGWWWTGRRIRVRVYIISRLKKKFDIAFAQGKFNYSSRGLLIILLARKFF